jgi:hypothetical protein
MSRYWVTCLGCKETEFVDTNSASEDGEEAFRERHKPCNAKFLWNK